MISISDIVGVIFLAFGSWIIIFGAIGNNKELSAIGLIFLILTILFIGLSGARRGSI